MNQLLETSNRQIKGAKREIQIYMNASERIKDMEIETVTIDYLQNALQSILESLEGK
tara:strand:- start:400 stop:570 length:171 start_codon:yes stop_codon:yes gene_type:complete